MEAFYLHVYKFKTVTFSVTLNFQVEAIKKETSVIFSVWLLPVQTRLGEVDLSLFWIQLIHMNKQICNGHLHSVESGHLGYLTTPLLSPTLISDHMLLKF